MQKCYANVTQNNANNVVDDTDCSFELGEDSQPGTVAGTLGGVDAEGDGMTFSIVAGTTTFRAFVCLLLVLDLTF